jgi:RecA-family ATPase
VIEEGEFDDWIEFDKADPAPDAEESAEALAPPARQPGEDDAEPSKVKPFDFRPLSSYTPEPVEWLWKGLFPKGNVTVVEGHPGIGKSTALVDLVARLTTGRPWPGEDEIDALDRKDLTVLWMTLEDSPSQTLLPRLLAAGGDPSRVQVTVEVPKLGTLRTGDNLEDVLRLEETVTQAGADVLIVDPGSATLEDGNSEAIVRQAMGVLFRLGQESGLTSIWIRHLAKASGTDGRDPLLSGIGSIGVSAAARSQIQLLTNERAQINHDILDRWFVQVKSNLGPIQHPIPYGLLQADIEGHPELEVARTEWGEPDEDQTIFTIARSNAQQKAEERQAWDKVENALLREFQRTNPLPGKRIIDVLRKAGIKVTKGLATWKGWADFREEYQISRQGHGEGAKYLMADQNEGMDLG